MAEELLTQKPIILQERLKGYGMPGMPKDPRYQRKWCWGAYDILTKKLDEKFMELRKYCSQIPEYLKQKPSTQEESELVGCVLSEINPLLEAFDILNFELYRTGKIPTDMGIRWDRYWGAYGIFLQRTRVEGLQIKPKFGKIS